LDALGRAFQCATVQLDFQLPIRFDLNYVGSDNKEHRPVVVHRAVLGSFERFIGILIEHYAGKFPVWLAPEQVRILTVSEKSEAHAKSVLERLKALGVEAVWDDSSNKIGYKIREARNQRIPYLLVIGAKEMESDSISVRSRDEGELGVMPVSAFLTRIEKEIVPAL
jgi:threonyl-tRNA synthetase